MNKERCIVYMLIKRYKYARDHANRYSNYKSSEFYHKEYLDLYRQSEYEAHNAMEFARRILYGTPL